MSVTRPRVFRSRRSFLKTLPTAIVAGAAAAAPQPAHGQNALEVPDIITAEGLDTAQHVIGVALPVAELEGARPIVVRNRDNYEAIRKVSIPSETEPAFSFRPPRPRPVATGVGSRARAGQPSSNAGVRRFSSVSDLAFESVSTIAPLIASRQVSSTALTRMYLDRLKRHDSSLFCVITLTEELALEQAANADKEVRAGRYLGPLHGIPYGIKDLFSAKGVPTTWGAKPYANQVFDYDSTAVARLREAGAVLLAKLSTGELAVGDLWFGERTRNPWNPERGASGSSAGPAAATAAGLVGFAVGTETGGSIISPASTCGVVGLRPTYGRISRYGCMTLRWTLDKVGPITRSAADTALVLHALHGPDGHDETVADVPFRRPVRKDVKGMRIGYVASEFSAAESLGPQASVKRAIHEAAMEVLRQGGATLVPIELPDLPAAAIYAILNAEAGAMFDELTRSGAINGLTDKGPNGRANQLRASRFIPAVEYIRAQRVRTLLQQQMETLLQSVDLFLAPSSSESVTMTNLTGHPAMVLPAGFDDQLPVGLMLTGKLWDEATLIRVGAAFEAATDWHTKHPAL